MMPDMMGGAIMWRMGLFGLLALVLALLAIAALVKCDFFLGRPTAFDGYECREPRRTTCAMH
jgi:hypothetical protein